MRWLNLHYAAANERLASLGRVDSIRSSVALISSFREHEKRGASLIRRIPSLRAWRPGCQFRGESESRRRSWPKTPSRHRPLFRRRRPCFRPDLVRGVPMLCERHGIVAINAIVRINRDEDRAVFIYRDVLQECGRPPRGDRSQNGRKVPSVMFGIIVFTFHRLPQSPKVSPNIGSPLFDCS